MNENIAEPGGTLHKIIKRVDSENSINDESFDLQFTMIQTLANILKSFKEKDFLSFATRQFFKWQNSEIHKTELKLTKMLNVFKKNHTFSLFPYFYNWKYAKSSNLENKCPLCGNQKGTLQMVYKEIEEENERHQHNKLRVKKEQNESGLQNFIHDIKENTLRNGLDLEKNKETPMNQARKNTEKEGKRSKLQLSIESDPRNRSQNELEKEYDEAKRAIKNATVFNRLYPKPVSKPPVNKGPLLILNEKSSGPSRTNRRSPSPDQENNSRARNRNNKSPVSKNATIKIGTIHCAKKFTKILEESAQMLSSQLKRKTKKPKKENRKKNVIGNKKAGTYEVDSEEVLEIDEGNMMGDSDSEEEGKKRLSSGDGELEVEDIGEGELIGKQKESSKGIQHIPAFNNFYQNKILKQDQKRNSSPSREDWEVPSPSYMNKKPLYRAKQDEEKEAANKGSQNQQFIFRKHKPFPTQHSPQNKYHTLQVHKRNLSPHYTPSPQKHLPVSSASRHAPLHSNYDQIIRTALKNFSTHLANNQ
jgi:hypothetical protein